MNDHDRPAEPVPSAPATDAVPLAMATATPGLGRRLREAAGRRRPEAVERPEAAPERAILLLDEALLRREPALPGQGGLGALLDRRPDLAVVVVGRERCPDTGLRWLDEGAADWLPACDEHLVHLPLVLARTERGRTMRGENERLHHDLARSLVELELKNQELETMVDRLERAARTDAVTRLANRRWLDVMLEGNWAEASADGTPLALVMIDLDGFKRLNDACGHQRGDEILRLVARVLEGNCRASDVVARYGGDEFCLLLPQTHPDEAAAVARRILGVFLEVMTSASGDLVPVGMSLGVAHVDLSRPESAADLLAHADEAMYAAKARGPNRYAIRQMSSIDVLAGPEGRDDPVRKSA